jgi:hypothetical protein
MAPSTVALSVATGIDPDVIDALLKGDSPTSIADRETFNSLLLEYARSIKSVTAQAARTRLVKLSIADLNSPVLLKRRDADSIQ